MVVRRKDDAPGPGAIKVGLFFEAYGDVGKGPQLFNAQVTRVDPKSGRFWYEVIPGGRIWLGHLDSVGTNFRPRVLTGEEVRESVLDELQMIGDEEAEDDLRHRKRVYRREQLEKLLSGLSAKVRPKPLRHHVGPRRRRKHWWQWRESKG